MPSQCSALTTSPSCSSSWLLPRPSSNTNNNTRRCLHLEDLQGSNRVLRSSNCSRWDPTHHPRTNLGSTGEVGITIGTAAPGVISVPNRTDMEGTPSSSSRLWAGQEVPLDSQASPKIGLEVVDNRNKTECCSVERVARCSG